MIKMKNKKLWIVVLVLIIILGYILIRDFNSIKKINLKVIEDYIESFGSASIAVFLVISIIRPLAVVIPITLITLIAGSIYGPFYGLILAMISTYISSSIAFYISRYLGKSFIEKIIKKRADKINLKIGNNGFKIIFFMRLSGVFPFDILSYAAGLTKVRYRDFILASILGSFLETFSIVYLGHNIKDPFSPRFIFSVVLVLITVGIPLIYSKVKASKNKDIKEKVK